MYLRLAYLLLIVAGLSATARGESAAKPWLGSTNAIWAQSFYFRGHNTRTKEKLTDHHLVEFADKLRSTGMRYVFIFCGPFTKSGNLPAWAYSSTARASVARLKELYPQLVVLPWVGGIQGKTVFLEDPDWAYSALANISTLVRYLGVSGVHIDFEFLLPDAEVVLKEHGLKPDPESMQRFGGALIQFHRRLREQMPEIFISSASGSAARAVKLWKRALAIDELRQLQKYSDQIAFMFYDTSIHDAGIYQESIEQQLRDIALLKSEQRYRKTGYLLGVGTFINEPKLHSYRDLAVEGLEPHFKALHAALSKFSPVPAVLDGTAVFCDWETDSSEWRTLSAHLGKGEFLPPNQALINSH